MSGFGRGGRSTVAYGPKPVGRSHPGVGQARIPAAPAGAWTNERQDEQK